MDGGVSLDGLTREFTLFATDIEMSASAHTFFHSCGIVGALLKIHPPLRIPLTRGTTTSRATRFVGTGGRKSRGNVTSDSNSFCISRRIFTMSLLPSAKTFFALS